MKLVLINGIELHTQSDAEVEQVLRWLTAAPEFSVPSTHSGLRSSAEEAEKREGKAGG